MPARTPLSAAERQQIRRQRLKAKAEEDKFSPESFVAKAVRDLSASGNIPEDMTTLIQKQALQAFKAKEPYSDVILVKYMEKKIRDFFKPTTKGEQ